MMRWLDILFPPREGDLLLRDIELDIFCARSAPRIVSETRPATATLLPYADPVARAAIHEAKYHGSEHAFTLLAAVLADFLPDYLSETRFDLGGKRSNLVSLVPVPLGAKRRKERGFNQVEEVAKRALKTLDLPDITLETTLLIRTRETPSQVSLERDAREKNMCDAFGVAHPANPLHLYLVLDDVLTTGATLQACLDALVAAGVPRERLLPIALAH